MISLRNFNINVFVKVLRLLQLIRQRIHAVIFVTFVSFEVCGSGCVVDCRLTASMKRSGFDVWCVVILNLSVLFLLKLIMQNYFNKFLKTCLIHSRNMSQSKLDKINDTNLWNKPDLKNISNDYIGLPDNKSNLRPILRHQPVNETYLEHKLRIRRLEVEQFNQNFWSNHNKRFYDEKELFIAKNKEKSDDVLSADKMSEFYKYFLDKNWYLHFYYNISWYIKNFELLILSFQTNVHSFIFKKK